MTVRRAGGRPVKKIGLHQRPSLRRWHGGMDGVRRTHRERCANDHAQRCALWRAGKQHTALFMVGNLGELAAGPVGRLLARHDRCLWRHLLARRHQYGLGIAGRHRRGETGRERLRDGDLFQFRHGAFDRLRRRHSHRPIAHSGGDRRNCRIIDLRVCHFEIGFAAARRINTRDSSHDL